jgi:hypothetical protein
MLPQFINRNIRKVVAGCAIVLIAATARVQAEAMEEPKIISPSKTPYGMSYGEWAAAWWQWVASVPASENPVLDDTGANAAVGQSGPVWFLAGTFGGTTERTIEVPHGKALFFPIVNIFVNSQFCVEPDDNFSAEEMAAYLDGLIDTATNLYVEIDGVQVEDLTVYRAASGAFQVTVPSDNVWSEYFGCADVTANTYGPNVADGYWIMLKPLKKGEHTITFGGDISASGFSTEVTYYITVT